MLIIVRHGESTWNESDRFTGWADVPLTHRGRFEARRAGRALRDRAIAPTAVHTSALARARVTADLILEECEVPDVPRLETERLNERHYGALEGMVRSEAVARFGAEQVAQWRRAHVGLRPPPNELGRGESLADLRNRLLPYIDNVLTPALETDQVVLVVSHGNAVRMLIQHLEGMSDEELIGFELPTGAARIYDQVSVPRRAG